MGLIKATIGGYMSKCMQNNFLVIIEHQLHYLKIII
jgi:hypothetical protein